MNFLVDTNVVSELRKADRCDAKVRAWFEAVAEDAIYLSVLTVGELRRGVELIRRRDHRSAQALDVWIAQIVSAHGFRLLPVDDAVADVWGRMNVPDPLPVVDGLLAATAVVHGLTLATRNLRDVERTGVACLNPFA